MIAENSLKNNFQLFVNNSRFFVANIKHATLPVNITFIYPRNHSSNNKQLIRIDRLLSHDKSATDSPVNTAPSRQLVKLNNFLGLEFSLEFLIRKSTWNEVNSKFLGEEYFSMRWINVKLVTIIFNYFMRFFISRFATSVREFWSKNLQLSRKAEKLFLAWISITNYWENSVDEELPVLQGSR